MSTGVLLKIFCYLENLIESVLYYGTKSVIYIQNVASPRKILTEVSVENLANEMEIFAPDNYIEELVTGDNKSYAFCVLSSSCGMQGTKRKARSITPNTKFTPFAPYSFGGRKSSS
jgi:hypothetical protein